MKRLLMGALALSIAMTVPASGQSLDDLGVQIHGYATQNFLYTTNNNIFTTTSSNGSPQWTEAVVNISALPMPKLRVAVQARYNLFGNYSNEITIDYAMADYKANDHFGVRFGKVKIPSGLFNETQDIDPSYIWALLPQSVYPIASRNSQLSLFGGVVYGTVKLKQLGQLEYRGWSGQNTIPSNDGYFLSFAEEGIKFTNGTSQIETGAALHWKTPLKGLMVGASDIRYNSGKSAATAGNGAYAGTSSGSHMNQPDFFARYEKGKLMVAVEANRLPVHATVSFGGPPTVIRADLRAYYAMATYNLTGKLSAGVYDSQYYDKSTPLGAARYSKDWVVNFHYDFSQFLYAKVEEHFLSGTAEDYDAALNPAGIQPTTKMTVLKVGISF
jgi:hypothetical protein